jgi:hypothetical protein
MFLHGSSFKGEVGLGGAYIGGNLECDGSAFENPFSNPDGSRCAIRADRITVNGGMFLRHQFSSKGSVRLINAKIGTLDCTKATIEGDGKNGFNAENASIAGHAVFDNFAIQNAGLELRGIAADDVSFRGATLTTVDLRFATIRRALRIKQIVGAKQALWDLRNANTVVIEDDKESWPAPGRLRIDGFTYQCFGGVSAELPGESSVVPIDFESRKQWIERDSLRPPYAYRQLANFYLRIGDTSKARQALYSLEELLHRTTIRESGNSFTKLLRWVWQQALKWTIGYGYRLWRAAVCLVFFLAMGFVLSYWGYYAHVIVPTDKDAYVFFVQQQYPPKGYVIFHALTFTIENSLPVINFSMSDHWRPVGHLIWWFFAQRIAGWFLSIFFVAGVTGLAKSEK